MQAKTSPIVITGIGAISTFGVGVENVWSALEAGSQKTTEDLELEQNFCLKVGDWNAAEWLGKRGLQFLRPSTQFLLGAAVQALQDGGLHEQKPEPDELGVVVASNLSGLQSITNYDLTAVTKGPQYVSPMEAPNTLANAPASHLAIRMQARALNTTMASGQCSGLDVLGYATKMLRENRARYVLVGGVEEINEQVLWFYHHNGVLPSERPEDAGRPFDPQSSGWRPGEGAAVLLLETREQAEARGARIYAEVSGWASAFAPHKDKRVDRLVNAAEQALTQAGLTAEEIGLVVAGANGATDEDRTEAIALQRILAERPQTPVTSAKAAVGELYGASGLFQAITAIGALQRGVIPPIAGLQTADDAMPPLALVKQATAWTAEERAAVLLTSQDLFGSTSAVVLRQVN